MSSATNMLAIIFTAFSFHVIMFGIEAILSIIIITQLIYEYFTGNTFFREESRKLMNYIAVTYSSSHFFLTAFTVMTLTFFPEFLVLAGQILFYPLGFIIIFLILRLSMIAYFWYGWDRLPKKGHLVVGILFTISGIIWVYLYSVLLSFMSYPKGLISISPLNVNDSEIFLNPTTVPLFLTIVFGAIATTTGFMMFYYGRIILNRKKIELPKTEYQYRLFSIYTYIGFTSFVGFIGSQIWYLISLKKYSEVKFSNWMGGLLTDIEPYFNIGWLFAIFTTVLLIILLGWSMITYKVFTCKYHDELITEHNKWSFFIIAPSIGILFEIFVLINFLSQTPYFIVSSISEGVKGLDVRISSNEYADIIDLYALTIFGFIPLFIAFFTLLYFIFTGRIGGEYEISGKVASEL